MDMVAIKKFFFRKYSNNSFSLQQLDFFRRLNASEIIVLLKQNTNLRSCSVFFQHTSVKQIEKVIASIFQPGKSFIKTQVFNILINILKQSTLLLQICFNNKCFNYMSIFGFLLEQNIQYPILTLMEDILLPYVRKNPQKIMQIISNDSYVKDALLNRIYEKPVFKIMYTIIFCLSKRHSQIYKDQIEKIVNQIVRTPFTYLLHQQKRSGQNINKNKTPVRKEKKCQRLDSSGQFTPLHIKQVGQRTNFNRFSSGSSERSLSRQKCLVKKKSGLSNQYISPKQSQISNKTRMKNQVLSLQQLTSLQQLQQIPLNQDLDFADLTYNMKYLFSDISFNIKSVYLKNVISLLQNFNQQYINCLIHNCNKYILDQQYEGYCQGIICIFEELGQLYRAVGKHSFNLVNTIVKIDQCNRSIISNTSVVSNISVVTSQCVYAENEDMAKIIMGKLEQSLRIIAKKIPFLIQSILENNQAPYIYSSGEKIKKIGLVKYKMLHLILQLLQLNNIEAHPSLNLAINFQQFDLFLIAQKFLTTLKWNNLMHNIIIKIIKIALEKDYQNFKKRHVTLIQMPKDGILGKLIQSFRNKKFVFLKNMKFTNYGHLNVIYQIGKLIGTQIKKHNDYELLIQKFAPFDTFLKRDLSQYQKNLNGSQFMQRNLPEMQSHFICNQVPLVDENGKIVNQSFQKVQEILDQIENSKRWTPLLWRNQKRLESLVSVDNFQDQCTKSVSQKP